MTSQRRSILDDIVIAAPCPVAWDAMDGDDRTRFCSRCELSVYNISDMSKKEADNFLRSNVEQVCLRFFRRHDGTIMTKDCPIGLRIVQGIRRKTKAIAMAIIAVFNGAPTFAETLENSDSDKSCQNQPPLYIQPTVLDERGIPMGSGTRNDKKSPTLPETSASSSEKTLPEEKKLADTTALNAFFEAKNSEKRQDFPGASVYYERSIEAIRNSKTRFDSQFVLKVAQAYAQNLRKVGLETKAKEIEIEFIHNYIKSTIRPSQGEMPKGTPTTDEEFKLQMSRDHIRGLRTEGTDVTDCQGPVHRKTPNKIDTGQLDGI